jgi:hypothetical protein
MRLIRHFYTAFSIAFLCATALSATPPQINAVKKALAQKGHTLPADQIARIAREVYKNGASQAKTEINKVEAAVNTGGHYAGINFGAGHAGVHAAPGGAGAGGPGHAGGAGAGAAHAIAPLADPYKFRGEIITAPADRARNDAIWHVKIIAEKNAGGATVAPAGTEIVILMGDKVHAAGLDRAHLNVATKIEFEKKSRRNGTMAPHVNEHGNPVPNAGNVGHYQALDRMQILP